MRAMRRWRSGSRRARRWLAGIVATVIIVLAVAMALGQLLLPLLADYPDRVAALLSERLHQPVSVRAVQGHWQGSGPLLSVSGLRIGRGNDALRLPEAELKVDFGAWIKRDRRWLELRIDGAVAHLAIATDSSWHLSGVELGNSPESGRVDQLADLPVGLLLRQLDLVVRDQRKQRNLTLQVPALRVLTRNDRLHLGGSIRQPGSDGSIEFSAEIDPLQSAGRAYMSGTHVDLAAWDSVIGQGGTQVRGGSGALRVWLGWQAGRLSRVAADVDLAGLVLARDGRPTLDLPRWHGQLKARMDAHGWRARWQNGAHDKGQDGGWFDVERHDSGALAVRAGELDVQTLAPWLALWPEDGQGGVPAFTRLRPWGRLDSLQLDWRDAKHFSLQAQVHGLGWKAAAGLPGIDHLDARVRGDGEAVSIAIPPQPLTADLPGVFRKPFDFSRISGHWSFWPDASGWRLATDDMQLKADDYALALRGGLRHAPGQALPTLDLGARVLEARVVAAKRFWPVDVMPPTAVEWLDRGLVSGSVTGRALFRGNLGDWPFPANRGRFEAVADFHDAVLDYDPRWPVAESLNGRAAFVNLAMHVKTDAGSSLGNKVRSASAEIAHFDHAELKLGIQGSGQAGRLLAWLRKTPIGQEHHEALAAMQVTGGARYTVKLNLPLHDDPGAMPRLDGQVKLSDAMFKVPDWSLDLQHLDGPLQFGTDSIQASGLTGDYNGVPVQLQARIGDATHQPDATVEASMHGRFDVPSLVQQYPSLRWLDTLAQGQSAIDVGLSLRTDPESGRVEQRLSLDSDLQGMALNLPAPLNKPPEKSQHLHLDLGLPLDGAHLAVRLGQLATANVRLASADQPLAASVAFGGRAEVAPPRGIQIRGTAPELDISGWLGQLFAAAAPGSAGGSDLPAPVSLQLDTGQAVISGHRLGPLGLKVSNDDNKVSVALDGKALAGQVSVPLNDHGRSGITVRMDRLYWPETDGGQNDTESESSIAPAVIPPLHVWIKDMRLGDARLGDVRVESVPVANGMQIEQFEAQSPDLKIGARGRWLGTAADNHSDFSMDISAEDMGRMLGAFGYGKLVAGGTTLVHVDGRWPGAPTDFSLAELDGTLKVHAADGRILEVEPGMGRLFGLFSIRELPRRLSLDFGDIFQSGYSFNSIDGKFRFENGNAWTDNLEMLGPSADIRITGRTGVRQHDYDQLIVVTPHLGVALPVVGAIAGGPIGVAAGLAMQGLLGKGINRAGEVRYKVTGSWDKPDIERLSREAAAPVVPVAPSPARSSSTAMPSSVDPTPTPATSTPTDG